MNFLNITDFKRFVTFCKLFGAIFEKENTLYKHSGRKLILGVYYMGNSILCPPSNSAQAQKVGGYVLKVKQGDAKAQEELNTMIIKACKLYYGPRTTYKYWVPNIEPVYRCSFPMQDSTRSQLLLKKPSRISETLRFPTSLHLKQGYSPTRSQLIQEAYLAFSDPATEHLTNVRRVRSDITGETFVIAGKIVKTPIVNNKNFLRKCLDFVKKIRK